MRTQSLLLGWLAEPKLVYYDDDDGEDEDDDDGDGESGSSCLAACPLVG